MDGSAVEARVVTILGNALIPTPATVGRAGCLSDQERRTGQSEITYRRGGAKAGLLDVGVRPPIVDFGGRETFPWSW